jgi:hypothetical protein
MSLRIDLKRVHLHLSFTPKYVLSLSLNQFQMVQPAFLNVLLSPEMGEAENVAGMQEHWQRYGPRC